MIINLNSFLSGLLCEHANTKIFFEQYLRSYLFLFAVYINMGLWELAWWEIILFIIEFGVVAYLIIKAPSSPDLTKKHTSCESTANEGSSNNSIHQDKSNK